MADTAGSDRAVGSPVDCAEQLLVALKTGGDARQYRSRLAGADEADLGVLREDRRTALAFWTNLYNAATQLLLRERPGLYESRLRSLRFFRADAVTVAGNPLSLDDVEHGILRGSRSKYGLGYLPRLRTSGFERRYRLSDPDPRVHFALNCGAASCPAIRAYEPDRVDEQLDLATEVYLADTVDHDPAAGTATVPRLFRWFSRDFGGRAGVVDFLREHGAIPSDATPELRYRSWDWSKRPGEFVEE